MLEPLVDEVQIIIPKVLWCGMVYLFKILVCKAKHDPFKKINPYFNFLSPQTAIEKEHERPKESMRIVVNVSILLVPLAFLISSPPK